MEALSVEAARAVELPRNPIKRIRKLGELGAAYGLRKVGSSPLPLYLTRGDLVRTAEARETAVRTIAILDGTEAPQPNTEDKEK